MQKSTIAVASRSAGLARLERFVPAAGREYADTRNVDRGPGRHDNVSRLSPYLTHRLVLEREVIAAVLERHSAQTAAKFIDEVFWRTYWKGWLELRPQVWERYVADVTALCEAIERDAALRERWRSASAGTTGIGCFDAWTRELAATGYLHNHARMWFASIWIFTLKLPWQLGADFFLRHLLDGDAASNTLSWRWVAGLQTRGKHYLATPENIATFTEGRFEPVTELDTDAEALTEELDLTPRPLPTAAAAPSGARLGLLLTDHDLNPETLGLANVVAATGFRSTAHRSPGAVADGVVAFADAAIDDALARARAHFDLEPDAVTRSAGADDIAAWARRERLDGIVHAHAPVGVAADALASIGATLQANSMPLTAVQRDWDRAAWPHATRGFFAFRKNIPALLRAAGLATEAGHG